MPPAFATARPVLSTSAHAVNVAIKEHPAGARGEGGGTRTSGAENEGGGLTTQTRGQCGVSAFNLFLVRQAVVPPNISSSFPITARLRLGAGHICFDRAGAPPSWSDGRQRRAQVVFSEGEEEEEEKRPRERNLTRPLCFLFSCF